MEISDIESDDYEVDATDDEWVESAKLHTRKRKSKGEHSSMEKCQLNAISENVKEGLPEGPDGASEETAEDVCCSCSKYSSCKTTKCKCRALGIGCGSSCGCRASKCANRASGSKMSQEGAENDSSIDEADKDRLLATQGAELLQGALVERPPKPPNDEGRRKALSDIGNTLVRVTFSFHVI